MSFPDRLNDVLSALLLGKANSRTMTGNVIVAVLFNIFGMILATLGFVTPVTGGSSNSAWRFGF